MLLLAGYDGNATAILQRLNVMFPN